MHKTANMTCWPDYQWLLREFLDALISNSSGKGFRLTLSHRVCCVVNEKTDKILQGNDSRERDYFEQYNNNKALILELWSQLWILNKLFEVSHMYVSLSFYHIQNRILCNFLN